MPSCFFWDPLKQGTDNQDQPDGFENVGKAKERAGSLSGSKGGGSKSEREGSQGGRGPAKTFSGQFQFNESMTRHNHRVYETF